jgi:uncharacterized membrane protein YukC
MNDIINALTGNVGINDNLVDQVLALINDLKTQQAAILLTSGANNDALQERIADLEIQLEEYRKKLEAANTTLATSIGKMRAEIAARPAAPALPGAEEKKGDGKRRSRKRNSRKRKSKRSKKRHY